MIHIALFKKGIPANNQHKEMRDKEYLGKLLEFISGILEASKDGAHKDLIMKSLEKGDKKVAKMLKGAEEDEKGKNKMIVFIEDTDEFLDLEGNKLGPFKKGDVANIAEEIANILIIDKKAEGISEE